MAVKAIEVLSTVRTFLNDDNASVWTDQALMPKLQEAHRELQTELWIVGSPTVRQTTLAFTVNAGVKNLVEANLQPADLLVPTALYEASPGMSDWTPMTEQAYFAVGIQPGATLTFWAWLKEEIILVGCTVPRQMVIHYRRKLPNLVTVNDTISVTFGELYLSARTAAMAAASVGNDKVHADMTAIAKDNLAKVVAANRGQQKPVMRP